MKLEFTLDPLAHPHSLCGLIDVFCFLFRGLFSREPSICCDNGHIHRPISRPIHDFHVRPTGYTTGSVPSRSPDLRFRRSFFSGVSSDLITCPAAVYETDVIFSDM